MRKEDPDFEYTWYRPREVDDVVKEEHDEKTDTATNPKVDRDEFINENDFGEATKEEAARPKRTWYRMIYEALSEAEDQRLPTEGVYAYVRQNYPYFVKDAERWEKTRTTIRSTLLNDGFKKVQGSDNEEVWVLHSYDGPDVIVNDRANSKVPHCKVCGREAIQ